MIFRHYIRSRVLIIVHHVINKCNIFKVTKFLKSFRKVMLPSFKEDEKIILTWLKSDNSLYYVTKNGIFRARVDKPERSVEQIMKMKEPVLSAWFSNISGQLSLLSLSSIIEFGTKQHCSLLYPAARSFRKDTTQQS